MKKFTLAFAAIAALLFQSCEKGVAPDKTTATTTINVSGLFSITGNWSTLGVNSEAALQLAANDINAYLQSKNATFRMSVSFYDTQLEPDSAMQDFLRVSAAGTHFIIGPQSSAELAAIVPLADSAQTIVISQGSTAGSLAIGGDPVFRFCPGDAVEGAAIAKTIFNDDIKGLVTVARNDAGNLGLQSATGSSFTADGGTVSAIPAYSTSMTDFSSVISSIKTQLTTLGTTYGAVHTGVYLASFDEGASLMAQAVTDSQLSQVKWYGGDGIVSSAAMLANTNADIFAVRTGFFAPSYGLSASSQSQWQPVANRIKAITGITPDAFALAAYDAMWVIAKTLEATGAGTSDFAQLKSVFVQQANSYTGITGPTTLNSAGDRANGTFDYWGIAPSGSGYQWSVVGASDLQ